MSQSRFKFVPEINLGHVIMASVYLVTLIIFLVRMESRLITLETNSARQQTTIEKVTDAQYTISRVVDRLLVLEEQRSRKTAEPSPFKGR